MRQYIKVLIIAVALVWIFTMGLIIGSNIVRRKIRTEGITASSETVTVSVQIETQQAAEAVTETTTQTTQTEKQTETSVFFPDSDTPITTFAID